MHPALAPFQPGIQRWFAEIGEPTPPQERGWPAIRAGRNVLIAAPTGTGKTMAAFLVAIDRLIAQRDLLAGETQVVYISPLKALGNDIEKNLQVPLAGVLHHDVTAPPLRVMVRSGDTTARDRAVMTRRPPHILVTTPESLGILLTSQGGRAMLSTTRSVIVDEIHALAGSKRGSHLSLSLERLDHLVREHGGAPLQRIGLSATQRPLELIAGFLVGADRACEIVDAGHLRRLDLGLEVPDSPLETVCSHEVWAEIFARMTALIEAHRTTLIFVNTRKLAERVAARLRESVGEDSVTCHHGSLSKERRLDAEQRLKHGRLRALVATASLELGIDIGDVDLVLQVGSSRSIATFLQRAGRAGHGVHRTPKARLFPLTIDELAEHAALLRATRAGVLDAIVMPRGPLDILAQSIVGTCVDRTLAADGLFALVRRAWPYRDLDRATFDKVVDLHTGGRFALLRRDALDGTIAATSRARLVAITCSGAIPDQADFTVKEDPEGTVVGTLDEDFSLESSPGDIFQLGTTSWQILRVDGRQGEVRVRNVGDAPPTIPFWFGEAPARSRELGEAVGALRADYGDVDWFVAECLLPHAAAVQLHDFFERSRAALGELPTAELIIAERFFDESGGQQLVIHSPFGARLNRAWGLGLRKKFCRGFGFELEAAAAEDAFLLSLAPTNSFRLDEVFRYLSPQVARQTVTQAAITGGQFEARWKWNVTRSLVVERFSKGKRVPPHLLRLRASDALSTAFPTVLACPENLPPGALDIPEGHPLVDQTIHDCLTELMDIDGLEEVLIGIQEGRIRTRAVDTLEASPLARAVVAAKPYAFLDDVAFEERRVRAVQPAGEHVAAVPGELDPAVVAEVQEELWPRPEGATEVAEVLAWIGHVTDREVGDWLPWLEELAAQGRALHEEGRWRAAGPRPEPVDELRGRLEAVGLLRAGPDNEIALLQLECEGRVLRARCAGAELWVDRPVLMRIHQRMKVQRRVRFEPVPPALLWRFLACWQHVDPAHRLEGPRGVAMVLAQLAGCEAPAESWPRHILPARVRDFRPEWLDELCLAGEAAWGRLWRPGPGGRREAGGGLRFLPLTFVGRDDLPQWLAIAPAACEEELGGNARTVLTALRRAGACFHTELAQLRIMPEHLEQALAELIATGLVTGDSYAGLRFLMLPGERRRRALAPRGRWGLFRKPSLLPEEDDRSEALVGEDQALFLARRLVARCGVVFRRLYQRERFGVPWRDLLWALRRLEMQGEILTGRFVDSFTGEQFIAPAALELLKDVKRRDRPTAITVAAADPLNYTGLLTPDRRVPITARQQVRIA